MARLISWWDRKPVKFGLVGLVAAMIGGYGFLSNEPTTGNDCTHPLRHVYHPQRLQVLDGGTCQKITFRIYAWRREHDGDIHADGVVLSDATWVDPANVRGQHGLTVVEFVPGDPRPAKFYANQVLELTVTKVYDQQHKRKTEKNGWIEGHPVFAAKDVTPPTITARPNRPGLVTQEDDDQGR